MIAFAIVAQLSVSVCPAALAVRSDLGCDETSSAVAVSADLEVRRQILRTIEAASARFESAWGTRPSRGAVVDSSGVNGALSAALRSQGVAWVFPWPLLEVARNADGTTDLTRATSAMAHEIGHLLFARHVWTAPSGGGLATRQYATSAPDWLDEVAAASLEFDDRLAADSLARAHRAAIPLRTFFSMSHPAIARDSLVAAIHAEVARRRASGESVSTMQLDMRSQGGLTDLATFYRQVRLFTRFVESNACGTAPWGSLAAALSHEPKVLWPADAARELCLPSEVDALNERFEAWIATRRRDPRP